MEVKEVADNKCFYPNLSPFFCHTVKMKAESVESIFNFVTFEVKVAWSAEVSSNLFFWAPKTISPVEFNKHSVPPLPSSSCCCWDGQVHCHNTPDTISELLLSSRESSEWVVKFLLTTRTQPCTIIAPLRTVVLMVVRTTAGECEDAGLVTAHVIIKLGIC